VLTPQAGAIAVRGDRADAEVLLVRAKKDPTQWIFPKGHIEPGETPDAAALRELREEAGVVGALIGKVGESTFRSGTEDVRVDYFLVRFLATAQPSERRDVLWRRFNQAKSLLTFDDARRLLDVAERLLVEDAP
jgi:8-oxo-dGTP pyrophosphatase MutT (NUDIX family)